MCIIYITIVLPWFRNLKKLKKGNIMLTVKRWFSILCLIVEGSAIMAGTFVGSMVQAQSRQKERGKVDMHLAISPPLSHRAQTKSTLE